MNKNETTKICIKCGTEKSIDLFSTYKHGRLNTCRQCRTKYSIAWYKKNREKAYNWRNLWANKNPDKIKLYREKEYSKHKHKYQASHKKYRMEHKDYYSKYNKEYAKKHIGSLSDKYIIQLIKRNSSIIENQDISKDLIALYRENLKLKRALRSVREE